MRLNLDRSTWRPVAFGDVVRNVNKTVKDAAANGIDRVIAMEHMDPGELKIGRWGDVAEGTTFTRLVRPGQTLFGKRRAYQRKVAYAEFDAICSGDIYTFEADETWLSGELLPFLVQSDPFFDHALDTSAGSLSPRTNWRDLANFRFDLPTLDEQERVADLLWAAERHRRSLLVLQDVLAASIRSTFTKLLAGVETEETSLGNVGQFTRGRRFTKADYVGGGLGCIHYAQIHTDFGASASNSITFLPESMRSSMRLARPGDLVIAGTSEDVEGVGKAVAWLGADDVAVHDDCFVFAHGLDPLFASLLFGSAEFDRAKRSFVSESKVVRLSEASLTAITLPVPDLADQRSIVEAMGRLSRGEEAITTQAANIRVVQQALSTDVFGGN